MFTIALTDLVIKAAATGLEYVVPKLADWVINLTELQAALKESSALERCIVLQDGTEITVRVDVNQVPGLKEALQRTQYATGSSPRQYKTWISDAKQISAVRSASGGGVSLLNGILAVSW